MFTDSHTHHHRSNTIQIVQANFGDSPTFYHSIGVHPWDSGEYEVNKIETILYTNLKPTTVAIGECGMDKLKGAPIQQQMTIFEQHVFFSEKEHYPLIIHCVKSWNELLSLRKKHTPKQPWIFHGFSKTNIVNEVVKSGIMVSIGTGILNHSKQQELINVIPLHQLLIETDDQNIEIQNIYLRIAQLKKISLSELNEIVTNNFLKTFTRCQIG
jgi:TatD DNase family protein